LCDGTNGQSGQVAYTLKNVGQTPGQVLVTAAFSFTDEANPGADLEIEGDLNPLIPLQSEEVFEGIQCPASSNCVVQQLVSVPLTGFADGQFAYTYTGSLGKPMVVRLIISTPNGENVFEFKDLSCNIILGTSFASDVVNIPAVIEPEDPPRPCAWWNFLRPSCVNDLSFWGALLLVFMMILAFVLVLGLITIECLALVRFFQTAPKTAELVAEKAKLADITKQNENLR
ncbi:hypothetical protein KDA14_05800, partial [Candidatus Saccharibacteria bacterium]|nr:hypothetical protein [Candidatus Saccharibacteria bacterium]